MRYPRNYLFEYVDGNGETKYIKIPATSYTYALQSFELEKPKDAIVTAIYLEQ